MSSDSPWASWHELSPDDGDIANFSKQLRNIRQSRGFSTESIAEKTGMPLRVVERLENGRWHEVERPYLFGYLRLYAQAVGLNPGEIIERLREMGKRRVQSGRARLDETGELLPKQEEVGATRMKIVVGGFVVSRRFTSFLFLILLLSLVAILISANRKTKPQGFEIPFDRSLAYAHSLSTGPIEFIPPESPAGISTKLTVYDLIASNQCLVEFRRGDGVQWRRHLQALDTLRIPVANRLFLTVKPGGNARLCADSGRILSATSSSAVIDTFEIAVETEAGNPH
jgi:transcriptional regulator with XRE-family HTH domain